MKKKIFLLFLLLILFLITSCADLSISLCKKTNIYGMTPTGRVDCVTDAAVSKVDYTICNKIQKERDELNTEFKDYINNDDIKLCYAEVSARMVDISVCDKIQLREKKKECYDEDSLFYIDVGLCKELKTQEERNKCFNELGLKNFEELGIKEQSISVCSKFDEQKTKDYCFSEIATRYEDESTCDLINDNEEKDKCYELVGVTSNDVSVCDKIQDQDDKNSCYLDVGVEKLDISICEKISNVNLKVFRNLTQLCIERITEKMNIQDLKKGLGVFHCDNILEPYDNAMCYFNIAVEKQNAEICQFIDSHPTQNECYMKIATIKKDISICDKMTPTAREECYNSLTE